MYAVHRCNWRLLAAALVWAAIDPFVFSPPETEDAWMTRGVLAERWWVREPDDGTVGSTSPNVCNTVAALAFAAALVAAWRRRPAATAVTAALAVGLKL